MLKKAILPILCCGMLTSCATMRHGKYQQVDFTSEPMGADVWIDGNLEGKTPLSKNLERGFPHVIQIDLPGYKPYVAKLHPTISGWFFGNVFLGGVVGIAVDAATGSMYKLSPSQLYACLESESEIVVSNLEQNNECQVLVVSKSDSSWEQIDSLEKELR